MLLRNKAIVAALTLPLAALVVFPSPASAQFSFGFGIGGGSGWHYPYRHYPYRSNGFFFGISPTIIIQPRRSSDPPPPPVYRNPSASTDNHWYDNDSQPVFVTGHWEYLSDGRQRWVPDHYEYR